MQTFEIGDTVQVRMNRAGGWRPGVVRQVHADGRISVSFTDIPEGFVPPAGFRRAWTVRPVPGSIRHAP